MRRHISSAVAFALALGLVACTGGEGADATGATPDRTTTSSSPPVETATATASPTPPALPEEPLPTSGPVAADCVEGWRTPVEGSDVFERPLGVIRRVTGVDGPLVVVDMRYFEGPESPPTDKGYLLVVRRWYVKLYAEDDLAFQGRFLVEGREFGIGLVAVAPYDTNGFRSPDWIGFQLDTGNPEPTAYEGLPGTWSGVPYDFVDGGSGLEIPGLPDEVVGCLAGT